MFDDRDLDGLPLGESVEIHPGVVVTRRSFLAIAAAVLGTAAVPGAARAQSLSASDSISLEEFFEVVNPIAQRLVADASSSGQDRYLMTVASHALRLGTVAPPKEWRDSGQGAGPGTYIGFHPGGDPIATLHWRMEPHTIVRTHAHTYGNVVTVGLRGGALVRNYEMVDGRDFAHPGTFRVRRTRVQWLGVRDVNLVNLEHDYMHGFEAGPDGAEGLDLTTRIRPKPETPVPYLDLGNVVDATQGIHEARWTQ